MSLLFERTFEVWDTVYLPDKDPKASTIYTINSIDNEIVTLYHPLIPGTISCKIEDIEHAPF